MNSSRTIRFVEDWMGVANHLMLEAANSGRSHYFGYGSGRMGVNSYLRWACCLFYEGVVIDWVVVNRLDWRSIHFGASLNRVMFFTSGVSDRYLRVFRSNPVDGCEDDAVEISIGVQKELIPMILDIFKLDFQDPNFPDNVYMLWWKFLGQRIANKFSETWYA